MGVSIAAGIGSATAAEWRAVPSLDISETYTDNVRLSPAGEETSDWVTDVNPSLRISGVGARASIRLDYSPYLLTYARQNEVEFRHSGSGRGNVELIEDHFFVNGSVSTRETFFSPFRNISGSRRNLSGNRRRLTTFSVGPRWEQRLGPWANLNLSYRYQFTDTQTPEEAGPEVPSFSDSSRHTVSATVSSGTNFQRFQWSVRARRMEENRRGVGGEDRKLTDELVRANARYSLNRTVAVTGSIGYQDYSSAFGFGRRDGLTWDAGLRLTPSRRTELSVSYGEQTENKRVSVSGSYEVSSRTSLSVSYSERFRTSQGILGDDLSQLQEIPIELPDGTIVTVPIEPDPSGNLDGVPDFPFTDRAFRRDRFSFGFSHSKERTSLSVSTYIEKRTFEARDREESVGIRGRITRNFSRYLDGTVTLDYSNREFGSREDDLYFATARLDYQLRGNLTGYLSYNLTKRNSSETAAEINENAVTVGLRTDF